MGSSSQAQLKRSMKKRPLAIMSIAVWTQIRFNMSVKRPFSISMFQLAALLMTAMVASWFISKKYYKVQEEQKRNRQTLMIIVATILTILITQYLWKKFKQNYSGSNWLEFFYYGPRYGKGNPRDRVASLSKK